MLTVEKQRDMLSVVLEENVRFSIHKKSIFSARHISFLLAAVLIAALFIFLPAHAQHKSVEMLRRDGDITLMPNGDAQIVETWTVQFSGGPFTYAYRSFYQDQLDGFADFQVAQEGIPFQQTDDRYQETPNTFYVSSLSWPDVTWWFKQISDQTVQFQLSYTVHGVVSTATAGDEFYWKFVEFDRDYLIHQVKVVVHLPDAVPADQIRLATYRDTREEHGTWRVLDAQTVEFHSANIQPHSEWEIRLGLPHGLIPFPKPAWQQEADQLAFNKLIGVTINWISGFLGLVYLLVSIAFSQRDRLAVRRVTQTDLPSNLQPAMVGVLLDKKPAVEDALATLFDLARRGFLKIYLDKSEPLFVRQYDDLKKDTLLPYERWLLLNFFGNKPQVKLSALRYSFSFMLPHWFDKLQKQLVEDGYFSKPPDRLRRNSFLRGLVGGILLIGAALAAAQGPGKVYYWRGHADIWLAAILVGIWIIRLLISGLFVPRTTKGNREAARWRAFRTYLRRLESFESLDEAQQKLERYLPYAVTFGLRHHWFNQFAGDSTPAPVWLQHVTFQPSTEATSSQKMVQSAGTPHSANSLPDPTAAGIPLKASGPTLDASAQQAFSSLDQISTQLNQMLEQASEALTSRPSYSSSPSSYRRPSSGYRPSRTYTRSSSRSSSRGNWSRGGGGSGGGSSGFG